MKNEFELNKRKAFPSCSWAHNKNVWPKQFWIGKKSSWVTLEKSTTKQLTDDDVMLFFKCRKPIKIDKFSYFKCSQFPKQNYKKSVTSNPSLSFKAGAEILLWRSGQILVIGSESKFFDPGWVRSIFWNSDRVGSAIYGLSLENFP